MKRKTLTAILGVAMALSLSTAAAAAPKGGAVIEINEPVVLCDASNPNQITVAVSVATNADLDGLWVQANRWEDVNPTMPGWSARFDSVEHWAANFTADKGATVPTSHTLTTSDATTWTQHSWIPDGYDYYTDTSDIFVINVNAWTNRKSKRNGQAWSDWTVDCSTAPVTVIPFTYPWDVPWDHD